MARSPQPRHRARHGSSAQWTLLGELTALVGTREARPGPVLAKASALTAAGGLVLALLAQGEQASATAGTAPQAAEAAVAGTAAALSLRHERTEQQVSRSVVRAVPVAVQAPAVVAPAAAPTFGAMSFTAVKKPAPKPVARPVSGSSGSAAYQSSGGGYDWAAANACSCARGLTQSSMKVLAAVKASFPGMNSIGGVRADSIPDHPSGRALDFMTSNRGYGDAIAGMLIGRAGELNIDYIIWYQRIWMPGQGWKHMSNRGGATANHMDHVHVSVRG